MPAVKSVHPAAQRVQRSSGRAPESRPRRGRSRSIGAEPQRAHDLIVFAASLHHLHLRPAPDHAWAAVRPGVRVVIVYAAGETSRDALRSWASLQKAKRRAHSAGRDDADAGGPRRARELAVVGHEFVNADTQGCREMDCVI